MTGLFWVNFASGASAPTCSQEMEGKQFCLSSEMMRCVKRFDPGLKAIKYEWDAVNASGQAFNPNTPMYKKIVGFTPAPCTDLNSTEKSASQHSLEINPSAKSPRHL